MTPRIGRVALLRGSGEDGLSLAFRVRILAEKSAYGHDRSLITPVAGTGERWVDSNRLTPTEETTTP